LRHEQPFGNATEGWCIGGREKLSERKVSITKRNMSFDRRRAVGSLDERPSHKETYEERLVFTDWQEAMRLSAFYENHVNKVRQRREKSMIMPRDTVQILTRMRSKRVYVCEEVTKDERVIHASSLLWEEDIPLPDVNAPYGFRIERFWEIGTQVSELGGFSLQWVLTAYTIFEMLMTDASGVLYAATYGDNKQAPSSFLDRMKFVKWDNLPKPLEAIRYHHLESGEEDETSRGVLWFRPTLMTVLEAAKLIDDISTNGYLVASPRSAKPGERIQIKFAPQDNLSNDSESEIQRRTLESIKDLARRIVEERPSTISKLRALGTGTVSDDFFQLSASELA
jgi:hypothetical protein